MNKVAALLLVVLLIVLLPQAIYAQNSTDNGVISGSLINGTAGAAAPANLVVSLTIYQNQVIQDVKFTNSSDQGQFTFAQLPSDASYTFAVGAVYQKVQYTSDLISFPSGQQSTAIQLKVYESTATPVPVSIMMSHSILNYTSGYLMIKEYNFFVNSADRTYLGTTVDATTGRLETLRLSMPAGASGFQPDPGLAAYLTVSGSQISYSAPLLPGTNQIVYSYAVACNSDSCTLDWKINYNISRYDLLILNQDVVLNGSKLKQEDSLNLNGIQYQDYSSQNLLPGDILTARLSGLLGKKSNSLVFLWLLLIPAAALVVFIILRRKKKVLVPETAEIDEKLEKEIADVSAERQKLLLQIARLDDRFEAGAIGEPEYRQLRSALKLKISKMNAQQND